MFARVTTVAFEGIEARAVDVQVQIGAGLPAFTIVGLPDKAVAESRERVRAALHAIGLALPPKRITVNLAPADLPKEGSHFDLPIALGLMVAMGAIARDAHRGLLRCSANWRSTARSPPSPGALPAAIGANAMGKGLICPRACGAEAAWAARRHGHAGAAASAVAGQPLQGHCRACRGPSPTLDPGDADMPDLRDVKGQESAKRALEIAAAGGHNLLMIGPPGLGQVDAGARGCPRSCRRSSRRRCWKSRMIHSLAGELAGRPHRARARPFRAPHHSASMAALVGGGSRPRPGEVSLAHLGVLFLDELPEFLPQVLDALRQPLETGETVIARANHRIAYPSRIQLVAAMNPCRCGGAGEPGYACRQGRAAPTTIRRASPARCSTASICRSRCRPSPPPTWCCRRRARAAPRCARASRARASASARALPRSAPRASAPTPNARRAAGGDRHARRGGRRAAAPGRRGAASLRARLSTARCASRARSPISTARTGVARVHVAEALSYRGETLRRAQVAA